MEDFPRWGDDPAKTNIDYLRNLTYNGSIKLVDNFLRNFLVILMILIATFQVSGLMEIKGQFMYLIEIIRIMHQNLFCKIVKTMSSFCLNQTNKTKKFETKIKYNMFKNICLLTKQFKTKSIISH